MLKALTPIEDLIEKVMKEYEDAAKLNDEMQTEKDRKLEQILAINIQVTEIEGTQKETQEFMKNLEKFI